MHQDVNPDTQRKNPKIMSAQNNNQAKLKFSYPPSILEHRSWKHTPCHMRHFITNFKLKLLDKWVSIVICTSHLREEVKQPYYVQAAVMVERNGMVQIFSTDPNQDERFCTYRTRLSSTCFRTWQPSI